MTVAFLHGFMGAPSMWCRVVSRLAAFPAAQAPLGLTLPGHGTFPSMFDTFDAAVDAIAEEIPKGSLLVGYSLGARVALGVGVRHPERVSRLVLIGVHPGLRDEDERRSRAELDLERAHRLQTEGLHRFVDAWESLPLFASQRQLPDDLRARRRAERMAHDAEGLAWVLRAMSLGRTPPRWNVGSLAPVTHLVTGELDTKYCALAREFAAANPPARHHVVPRTGHDVALESPDELAAILAEALALETSLATPDGEAR